MRLAIGAVALCCALGAWAEIQTVGTTTDGSGNVVAVYRDEDGHARVRAQNKDNTQVVFVEMKRPDALRFQRLVRDHSTGKVVVDGSSLALSVENGNQVATFTASPRKAVVRLTGKQAVEKLAKDIGTVYPSRSR